MGFEGAMLLEAPKSVLLRHHALPSQGQWLAVALASDNEILVMCVAPRCSVPRAVVVTAASLLLLKQHAAYPERVMVAVQPQLLTQTAGLSEHGEPVGHYPLVS